MKNTGLLLLLFCLASAGHSQTQPYLKLDIRQNFITQKIDFLDGPKRLTKLEIQELMARENPETQDLYRKTISQSNLNSIFAVAGLAVSIGTIVYVVSPQRQSFTSSNLGLPLALTSIGLEIVSGVFRRNARNLARETVDSYNFGRTDQPVYFEENRIDQPIFSKVIRF